jgi:hypothetical protein
LFVDPNQTALPGVEDPGAEGQVEGGTILSDAAVVHGGVMVVVSKSVAPGIGNGFAVAIEP